jgi:hypothetical protein
MLTTATQFLDEEVSVESLEEPYLRRRHFRLYEITERWREWMDW